MDEQIMKGRSVELVQFAIDDRGDRRGSPRVREQGHLTEVVAFSQEAK
jgi:hypothetical protein